MKIKHIVFLLAIIVKVTVSQAQIVDFFKKNAYTIDTIDPDVINFDDLSFLKETLKDVDMIMLGEQSHGDGATFLAKTRLIKFLHEELDFKIIAFESSMFDGEREWKRFLARETAAVEALSRFIFPVWTQSRQFQPLMEYIDQCRENGDHLRFCGFDAQPNNMASADERFAVIEQLISTHALEVIRDSHPYLFNLFFNPGVLFRSKPDSLQQNLILKQIRDVGKLIIQTTDNVQEIVAGRALLGFAEIMYMFWNADFQHPESCVDVMNIRDRIMGENLIWLKETYFSDEKIIVWGANSHLNYNRHLIEQGSEIQMIPAAQYVKNRLGDRLYTVAFTSFDGQAGTVFRPADAVPPANPKALETEWAGCGDDFAFLDCRVLPLTNWLHIPQWGRLYGYGDFKAPWAAMTDGIFFIKSMKPSVRIEKGIE
ncbi:erythromycin esterase family protein [bacterium]|nr:erythromycin esterase family protein [bacterium]